MEGERVWLQTHTFIRLGDDVYGVVLLLEGIAATTAACAEPCLCGAHQHIAGILGQLDGESICLVQVDCSRGRGQWRRHAWRGSQTSKRGAMPHAGVGLECIDVKQGRSVARQRLLPPDHLLHTVEDMPCIMARSPDLPPPLSQSNQSFLSSATLRGVRSTERRRHAHAC